MGRRSAFVVVVAVVLAALVAPVVAQEEPKPELAKAPEAVTPRPPRRTPTLLRVQIAIARYQGERKVASVPYTVLVTNDGKQVRLRMGVEVPIAVATFQKSDDGKSVPSTSFQYKNVGTNIDCRVEDRALEGLFQLILGVESSSIYTTTEARTSGGLTETGLVPDRPLFRTFNVGLNPTLRDGQSIQVVASTDPVTGEVVKIDVMLNVVK
jgi:hypothetical protein